MQEAMPQGLEAGSSDQQSTEENLKNTKVSMQGVETSLPNPPGTQTKSQLINRLNTIDLDLGADRSN